MRDRWEILANYKMQRVPQTQIAEILGVSDATVSAEVSSEAFQEYYTEHLKKNAQQQNEYDDGWDGLEKLAIGNLLGIIKNPGVMYDPKLNLQIAMVANKAQRRMSRFNQPLDAGNAGRAPVVINLRSTFINKVQTTNNVQINSGEDALRAKMLSGARVQNLPSPNAIENFLTQGKAFSNDGTVMEPLTLEQEAEQLLEKVKVA